MATITTIPWLRHLRTESSSWVRHNRSGSPVRTGRGLAFWFSPLSASIAEIPADDRELPILFHGRSADYQDVAVQAVLTWRVADPETLADRVDFSIDIGTGAWLHEPLEQVATASSSPRRSTRATAVRTSTSAAPTPGSLSG